MTKMQKGKLCDCGMKVDEVLERTMGLEDLLVKVFRSYVDSPVPGELWDAVEKGEYDTAFQRAHALKGMAGNLSLTEVKAVNDLLVEHLRNQVYDSVKEETRQVLLAHEKAAEGIREVLRSL